MENNLNDDILDLNENKNIVEKISRKKWQTLNLEMK